MTQAAEHSIILQHINQDNANGQRDMTINSGWLSEDGQINMHKCIH